MSWEKGTFNKTALSGIYILDLRRTRKPKSQQPVRHELETRLSHKPWTQEISKVTDWPRRRAVADFWLCVGHDCLGAHLHRIGIRPDPNCTLCSLHEPMDRNHLGQCTTLTNKAECERYWEAGTKMIENWLCYFVITIFCGYPLALGLSYLP